MIGGPLRGSDWKGAKIGRGDVTQVTKQVIRSLGGKRLKWKELIAEVIDREILTGRRSKPEPTAFFAGARDLVFIGSVSWLAGKRRRALSENIHRGVGQGTFAIGC
jgi:hypothetical protein